MKNTLFILLLSFCAVSAFSQKTTSYNKKVGIPKGNPLIFPTPDNGCLLPGYATDYAPTNAKYAAVLVKLDKNGNVVFNKGIKNTITPRVESACELKNGGYVFACNDIVYGRDYLVCTDANFKTLWTIWLGKKTISVIESAIVSDITELNDGSIFVTGSGIVKVNNKSTSVIFAITFDNKGSVIQNKIFSIPNITDVFVQARLLKDGNLLLNTSSFIIDINGNIVFGQPELSKYNPKTGAIIWGKVYNRVDKNVEYILDFDEDKNGNIYATLNSSDVNITSSLYSILKVDNNGNEIWTKDIVNVKYPSDTRENIFCLPNGEVYYSVSINKDLYFLQFDAKDNLKKQWSEKTVGFLATTRLTSDFNFISSYSYDPCDLSFSNGNTNYTYIRKRNPENEKNCSLSSSFVPKDAKINILANQTRLKYEKEMSFDIVPKFDFFDFAVVCEDEKTYCDQPIKAKRCDGDFYKYGNQTFTKTGIYNVSIGSKCAATEILDLTFEKGKTITIDTSLCILKPLKYNGKVYKDIGVYQDTLKSKLGCDSILLTINIKKQVLNINVAQDTILLESAPVTLKASANLVATSFQWTPNTFLNCVSCAVVTATPNKSIEYTVKGTTTNGCEAEKKVKIELKDCVEIFAPTAFSPNGDGINDTFLPFSTDCATIVKNYIIYDRWGNQVFGLKDFLTTDVTNAWNGKFRGFDVPQGVFVYFLELEYIDKKTRQYRGEVMVTR